MCLLPQWLLHLTLVDLEADAVPLACEMKVAPDVAGDREGKGNRVAGLGESAAEARDARG